jgi:hypothetical protein
MPEEGNESSIPQINIQGDLDDLSNWIVDEINRALAERTELDSNIAEFYRLYEAEPLMKKKTFPWDGASNLVVPVIATAVEAIVARLVGAIFATHDLWTTAPRSAAWVPVAKPIERWINWVQREQLKAYDTVVSLLLSSSKVGTGILKLVWEKKERNVVTNSGDGTQFEKIVIHEGPVLRNVPLIDFLFSSDALAPQDIQTCEWVAHRTIMTWKQLKELETSGIFTNVDRIVKNPRTAISEVEEQTQTTIGVTPLEYKDYEIWEVWASYDTNEDGILEEVLVNIHLETKTCLRAIYNPYRHQERPFHMVRHMPRDNHLLGIGLCQMLKDIQAEICTLHNQRIDNATIANCNAFTRTTGCKVSRLDIFPGAVIPVNSDGDIKPLEMGREHPTQLQEELHTGTLAEKRSGVSDYTVGRESAAIGSRATATSTMALIAEGNKRFQFIIRDIREVLTGIAHQIISLYQQFSLGSVSFEMFSDEERRYVTEYLQLPLELSRNNIMLDVPTVDEGNNKSIKQQTSMSLMGMVKPFYEGIVQALMIAQNQQIPQPIKDVALQGAVAATKLWEKVLESFDIVDTMSYVPNMEEIIGGSQGSQGSIIPGQTGNVLGAGQGMAPGIQNIEYGTVSTGEGFTNNTLPPRENTNV